MPCSRYSKLSRNQRICTVSDIINSPEIKNVSCRLAVILTSPEIKGCVRPVAESLNSPEIKGYPVVGILNSPGMKDVYYQIFSTLQE